MKKIFFSFLFICFVFLVKLISSANIIFPLGVKKLNIKFQDTCKSVIINKYMLDSLLVSDKKHDKSNSIIIDENGLNIPDMSLTLLKKVEELTLHLIQVNKDIKALANENKNLRMQLESITK